MKKISKLSTIIALLISINAYSQAPLKCGALTANGVITAKYIKFPATLGALNQSLQLNTADSTMGWVSQVWDYKAKTANFTATSSDASIAFTTGATNDTLTLGACSTYSTGKVFFIEKIDNGVGSVIVKANGSQLIDAANTKALASQYSNVAILNTGSKWLIMFTK